MTYGPEPHTPLLCVACNSCEIPRAGNSRLKPEPRGLAGGSAFVLRPEPKWVRTVPNPTTREKWFQRFDGGMPSHVFGMWFHISSTELEGPDVPSETTVSILPLELTWLRGKPPVCSGFHGLTRGHSPLPC